MFFLLTHHCVLVDHSVHLTQMVPSALSVFLFCFLFCILVLSTTVIYSTRSEFLHAHMVILLKSFTIIDAMHSTVSAPYTHALTLHLGPTYPPLGHSPSISANVNNARESQNASGFIVSSYCIFCIIIYLYWIWLLVLSLVLL